TFTLDGKLYSDVNATTALTEAGVALKIQILDPTQACVLYEESQTVDTTNTKGFFTVRVGSPTSGASSTKRGGLDVGNAMAKVYSN
ncbi:hypothetical protein, partial [Shewanella algae]|uniref:hypothetical protein n=1 Tax=Shewanella algae TaxID=38313 RepID=UPI00313ABC59